MGNPEIFDNTSVWGNYPLYISQPRYELKFNRYFDIELLGLVKLNTLILVLEPVNANIVIHPRPPVDNEVPHFLLGKNIFRNSGNPVQIGETIKLEKGALRPNDKAVFADKNYVFEDFKWVNITTLESDSMISMITVSCLDSRGYEMSFNASNTRGQLIKDLQFQKGKTLAFEIDRDCKYINAVTVFGNSPKLSGSRARINVDLN